MGNVFGKNQQKMKFLFLLSCLSLALSLPRQEDAGLNREFPPLWYQKCEEIYGDNDDEWPNGKDYCDSALGRMGPWEGKRICDQFVSGECCQRCMPFLWVF